MDEGGQPCYLAVGNSSFLPALYPYDHVLYQTLSPWWVFVPIGIILLAFSALAMRKSIVVYGSIYINSLM
jgi:hypothetical protein